MVIMDRLALCMIPVASAQTKDNTVMKTTLAFLTLGTLLIGTLSFAQPAPLATNPPAKSSQILAQQKTGVVCTIYAGNLSWAAFGLRIVQYSTMGLVENCDEKHFNQLTIASINAQLRAVQQPLFIIQGAAHHYLMDVNLASLPKPFVRIGELKMSPVGYVDVQIHDLIMSKGLREGSIVGSEYTPFPLTSNIHYIWNIGKPVHRLVAPNGDRYVMFGYTNRVLKDINKDNLALISPMLTLPANWKYESYLLDRTLTIKTDPSNDFTLNVLFDDAFNMYIQSTD